jgi:DNA-binding CsgD family transcriptional regulator
MENAPISRSPYGERRIDKPHVSLVGLGRFDPGQSRVLHQASGQALSQMTARARSMSFATEGSGALKRGALMLSNDGIVRFATRGARRLIARYFDAANRTDGGLPTALRRWIAPRRGSQNSLVVYRADRRLVLRRLSEPKWTVVLLEEGPQRPSIDALGLTRRETEVAACLALGKTNAEIAAILGMRARTVGKHLERIYEKLGVETRTAAAARVLEAAKTLSV